MVESDSSELSESSSDSESGCDGDDEEMAGVLETSGECAWQVHEERDVQEYEKFPKLFHERKFCFLSVGVNLNTAVFFLYSSTNMMLARRTHQQAFPQHRKVSAGD